MYSVQLWTERFHAMLMWLNKQRNSNNNQLETWNQKKERKKERTSILHQYTNTSEKAGEENYNQIYNKRRLWLIDLITHDYRVTLKQLVDWITLTHWEMLQKAQHCLKGFSSVIKCTSYRQFQPLLRLKKGKEGISAFPLSSLSSPSFSRHLQPVRAP